MYSQQSQANLTSVEKPENCTVNMILLTHIVPFISHKQNAFSKNYFSKCKFISEGPRSLLVLCTHTKWSHLWCQILATVTFFISTLPQTSF